MNALTYRANTELPQKCSVTVMNAEQLTAALCVRQNTSDHPVGLKTSTVLDYLLCCIPAVKGCYHDKHMVFSMKITQYCIHSPFIHFEASRTEVVLVKF